MINNGMKAIPYHASVRLRLSHFKQIKDKNGDLIGRIVKCEVKKNKVAPPMRTMYYTIRWGDKPGAWIDDAETMWDSGIRSGVLEKVTAQKYRFVYPSTGEEVEMVRRVFNDIIVNDENFKDEFKTALANSYIITAENITEDDVMIVDSPDEEGLE